MLTQRDVVANTVNTKNAKKEQFTPTRPLGPFKPNNSLSKENEVSPKYHVSFGNNATNVIDALTHRPSRDFIVPTSVSYAKHA